MADDQQVPPSRAHGVGVFSAPESARELEARTLQRDRLGGWAGARAAAGAAIGAAVGGGGGAVAAAVAGASGTAVVGTALGAGALAGALGGLWGAFSAVRPTADWRAGVPDAEVRTAGTSGGPRTAPQPPDNLASLGAVEVIDLDAPHAGHHLGAALPADQLAAPASTAHEELSLERFVGVVPVVVVFLAVPGDRAEVLAALEHAHVELGRRTTQLLAVVPPRPFGAAAERPANGTVPLLFDHTGEIGERFGLRPLDDDLQAVVIGLDGVVKLQGGFAATPAIGRELVAIVDRLRRADPAAFRHHADQGEDDGSGHHQARPMGPS